MVVIASDCAGLEAAAAACKSLVMAVTAGHVHVEYLRRL